jgi:hypothetical protein
LRAKKARIPAPTRAKTRTQAHHASLTDNSLQTIT